MSLANQALCAEDNTKSCVMQELKGGQCGWGKMSTREREGKRGQRQDRGEGTLTRAPQSKARIGLYSQSSRKPLKGFRQKSEMI